MVEKKLFSKEFFKIQNPKEVISSLRFWQGFGVAISLMIFLLWIFVSSSDLSVGEVCMDSEEIERWFAIWMYCENKLVDENIFESSWEWWNTPLNPWFDEINDGGLADG